MITPEEFPYIKSLYVNNCYTYKDFNIELHDYKPFSHLILTGKNGSGKSTILKAINRQLLPKATNQEFPTGTVTMLMSEEDVSKTYKEATIKPGLPISLVNVSLSIKHKKSDNGIFMPPDEVFKLYTKVYSYFEAKRGYKNKRVEGPTKESDFIDKLNSADSTDYFTSTFKQYLVNKKIEQAFDQIDNKTEQLILNQAFFETLRLRFSEVLSQQVTGIDFDHKNYEFYFNLANGRRLTFDTLSDGFSAFLSILMDLFIRVDLIRKQVNNYIYDPCGVVLIDEPETHLHLQLQEQVLPLLTNLFPNVQFIVATHSPAVIASIKNTTIFDLTTKETRISEETVGRSYSDLMRAHFGLNNEYSGIADELFRKVDQIIKEYKNRPEQLRAKLQQFFAENEAYLSPSFRVELESMILENA
ncbi:AAA family ATPase [Spirosoma sp.]|uniref:AAA family ATPase n=1 Tax=Spirosoma sp. TaxID=1899569 RepID=UPI003B3A3549